MNRILAVLLAGCLSANDAAGQALELHPGDRVCLVGNALGERMQHHNWWETLLHESFGDQELTVRNLCFPGDEPNVRIRSKNFGAPDEHLAHSEASVVLYFFGFNESFRGEPGVETFSQELHHLVKHTLEQDYSGLGAPRVVLISPIAFEDVGDPNLPTGEDQNRNLELYTAAMREAAEALSVGFVDLFHPTQTLFAETNEQLTLNGAHLNDEGYRRLAPILMRGLFGPGEYDLVEGAFNERLKAEIDDKNFHWWHRYRAVNGFSIYGDRGLAGSDGTYNNRDVMERERTILDQMAAIRDRRIWSRAQGRVVTSQPDDSTTLPFIVPKTNVGGENDPNRRRGKLGTLDYLTSEEQMEHFQLAPGYEIQLVASEEDFPELANPVALNFDNQGRLWVATMASYPHWRPKTKLDDKLLIFEDHDGDGRSDECIVFADGLHQPTGFEIGRGGVFVAQQPDILYLKDENGDDRADFRERRLVGFCSADSHHGLAAFEWGPDGGLYFQEGTFKYSQVESPYGLTRLHEAGVWRYDPRTEKFGVHVSLAFANPWGHVFDPWGQNFIGDASPGFSYWAAPISGRVAYPMKHRGGAQFRRVAQMTGDDGSFVFPTFYPKRIRPLAGCAMVSSRHFPPEVQGNFLVTNCIGERTVLNHQVRESGSGFVGTEVPPIVSCEDGNFRPVDAQIAPDGSLYIVDWHNALIGHLQHNLREPHRDHSHGRIWRVTYRGRPLLTPAKIAGEPIPALLELLKEPEDRTRYRARRELAERATEDVTARLDPWIASLDSSDARYEHQLLEALWIAQTHNVVYDDLLTQLLNANDHRARAAAVRALSFWLDAAPRALERLKGAVGDEHPRVRLEAVRALSFYADGDDRVPALEIALAALDSEVDEYLQYTLDETVRVLERSPHEPPIVLADGGLHGADVMGLADSSAAMHAGHDHAAMAAMESAPRTVFLDKSEKVVRYQLARLGDAQLLRVPRRLGDERYAPVFEAILARAGMSLQHRQEALSALVDLRRASPVEVMLDALAGVAGTGRQQDRTRAQLAAMLLSLPSGVLDESLDALRAAMTSSDAALRPIGYAGVAAAQRGQLAWVTAKADAGATRDWLASVALIPVDRRHPTLHGLVAGLLAPEHPDAVRRDAVAALAEVPGDWSETIALAAPLAGDERFRAAAVQTLLKAPSQAADVETSRNLVSMLVDLAESTSAEDRTTNEFLDAMQLADQLMAALPIAEARRFRRRLRETTVRVVRIHTVEEEMRYDTPYFAVEAGRPVQIVLQNEDLMPHNLVVTAPGALREVAEEGATLGPRPGFEGKPYVPESPLVLFATEMVQAGGQARLTFTAPSEPGEFPFVCTFPRHWMRMYGVMVVTDDLDAWLQDPVAPDDPIGGDRFFVQAWTIDALAPDLDSGLAGRTPAIGERLFSEATCAQCHQVQGVGGAVGPALDGVFAKWKNDPAALLQEVLDPSHQIEPQYAVHIVVTNSGEVVTGIVQSQNAASVSILSDPEAAEPKVIPRSDIDEMIKTSTSLMPKALLDRYTKDEIMELLAYLQSLPPREAASTTAP